MDPAGQAIRRQNTGAALQSIGNSMSELGSALTALAITAILVVIIVILLSK
jgi:hypothetical protein